MAASAGSSQSVRFAFAGPAGGLALVGGQNIVGASHAHRMVIESRGGKAPMTFDREAAEGYRLRNRNGRLFMIRFTIGFFGAIFTAVTLGIIAVANCRGRHSVTCIPRPARSRGAGQLHPAHDQPHLFARGHDRRRIRRRASAFRVGRRESPDLIAHAFVSAEDRNFLRAWRVRSPRDRRGLCRGGAKPRPRRARCVDHHATGDEEFPALTGRARSSARCAEIILAARIETALSKDRILELYLNEIFLGQNSYGVAAAAQTYFNANLEDLTLEQAAYLAALPQAPSSFHPVRDYDRAISRRNYVLREMYENGYISREEMERARERPLETVQGGHIEPFRTARPPRNYFTDEIRRQLSAQYGEDEFFTGGFSCVRRWTRTCSASPSGRCAGRSNATTATSASGAGGRYIDPSELTDEESWRAALAEAEIARDIDGWYPAVVLEVGQSAARIGIEGVDRTRTAISSRPRTFNGPAPSMRMQTAAASARGRRPPERRRRGAVRAMTRDSDGSFLRWTLRRCPRCRAASWRWTLNTVAFWRCRGAFPNTFQLNRGDAPTAPGSSFKPFVFAAALDSGYSPNTIVLDAPSRWHGRGIWRPQNASNQFYGPSPLSATGIELSRNLMTVRLAQDVGMETVTRYAEQFRRLRRHATLPRSIRWAARKRRCSAGRGLRDVRQRRRAGGSDTGRPHPDRWGTTVYRHDQRLCPDCELASLEQGLAPAILSNRERVMDPITAYQLTSMMRGVVDRGTASSTVNLPVPTAGKTGTTNGGARRVVRRLHLLHRGGLLYRLRPAAAAGQGRLGRGMCGPVFNEFMQEAIREYGGGAFEVPPGGVFYPIDRFSGQRLPDGAQGSNVVYELFREGEEPYFGILSIIDGGWGMGSDLPLYGRGEGAPDTDEGETVTTSTGEGGAGAVGKRLRHAEFRRAILTQVEGGQDCPACAQASRGPGLWRAGRAGISPGPDDRKRPSPMRAETQANIEKIRKSLSLLGQRMDIETAPHRLEEFKRAASRTPTLWDDPARAQKLMRDRQALVRPDGHLRGDPRGGWPTMSS